MKSRITVAMYTGIFLLIILSLVVLGPFLLSITLGAAIGVALLPLKERLCSWLKLGHNSCAIVVCTLFALLVLTPMVFATWSLVTRVQSPTQLQSSIGRFERKTTAALTDGAQLVSQNFDRKMVQDYVRKARAEANVWVQEQGKYFLTALPDLIVHFLMILLAMFLALTGYRKMISKMYDSHLLSNTMVSNTDDIMSMTCRDVFFSNIIASLSQSVLVAVGIAVFTNHDPYLTFVFTFLVSFIPVIGAAPVAAAAAVFELVEKNYGAAGALAALTCVVGVSDNIVRAMLMAHDKEDSPTINLLACIGGIYVWGLPGLFVGPLVVTLAIKLTPLFFDEVRRQPGSGERTESKPLILAETTDVS